MIVLIDSWAWIEYIKGSDAGKKVEALLQHEEILTSSMNIAEVYKKLLADMPKEANQIITAVLTSGFPIPVDTEIAMHAAKLKHEKKIGMADAIVLATARMHKAKVVTGDDDFKHEPDVIYLGR